jgi:phosphatidylglycerophosphate synthase
MVTLLGLLSGLMSGWFLVYQEIWFAMFTFGLSVFCDALDGTIAREFKLETEYGLVFDSVADRCTEMALTLGAVLGGFIHPIGFLAIVGSITLLSMRTLSHFQGLDTDYVRFGRIERIVFISFGILAPNSLISTICYVVAGILPMISSWQIINFLHSEQYE